jgi:predicted PurR-regulated permease PerM
MKENSLNNSVYDTTIRLLIVLLIIVWCLMILYPFTNILLWSLILAMAMHPLHKKLSDKLGGKRKLTSFLIVFAGLCLVVIPSWVVIDSLVTELRDLKSGFETNGFSVPPPAEKIKEWPVIGENVYDVWNSASVNLEQTIEKYRDQLLDIVRKLASGIMGSVGAAVQILLSFIIAAIILVYGGAGEAIRKFFRKLAGERGDELADVTMGTVSSVLKGVIGVALIVAVILGILFFLAGVPYAGLWTLLVFVLGILQLPALLVTLPIIIYLFATTSTGAAVIWTILIVIASMSDNVLKPLLLGKGAPVPTLVIFLGVVGGFIFSGFIGLFTGAIVMSLGYILFMGWLETDKKSVKS